MHPTLGLLDSTLRVMPTMVCKSLPSTSSDDQSSFWSTSSRRTSSTSILDTSETFNTDQTFESFSFPWHNPPTHRHAPPDELAQPATRPTPDHKSSDTALNLLPPALEPWVVNLPRCLAIIRTLRTWLVEVEVSSIRMFTYESHRPSELPRRYTCRL